MHSSAALIERAVGEDQVKAIKAGFRLSKVDSDMPLFRNLVASASTEISNSASHTLWKNKFFVRAMMPSSSYNQYLQLSLNGGLIRDLGSAESRSSLRVNDAFYLQNFKGIKNLGYHYDASASSQQKKKGLAGDILGFDKFLNFNIRLLQTNCPILSDYEIEPFLFFNAAFAPNRSADKKKSFFECAIKDNLRMSSGFGFSLQLQSIAIECLYNVHVVKQQNELRSDFQINIGID
jgi:outer membrane protein assembly factor BamA